MKCYYSGWRQNFYQAFEYNIIANYLEVKINEYTGLVMVSLEWCT